VAKLFDASGHEGACAFSGEEMLTRLRDEPVDLLLLDMTMPRMNGLDCLRLVRANPSTRRLPVFIYSALADQNLRDRASEAGALGVICKTTPFDQLLRTVDPYLGDRVRRR
jgi:two-component system chemotaxis response regulator CheY